MSEDWLGEYLDQFDFLDEEEVAAIRKYFVRVEGQYAANTLATRKVATRQFIQFLDEEGLGLFDADSLVVEDWVNSLLRDDYAPRSVRGKAYDISALYQRLVERGYVETNPVEDADGIEGLEATRLEVHSEKEYLTQEEYQQLLDACDSLRNTLVIQLLWNTGVRVSEAVGIRIDDIDREQRSIEIANAKTKRYESPAYRTVYFSRDFARTLSEWLDNGGRAAYHGAHKPDDEGHLLITRERPRMAVGRITEIVDEVAQKAGLQEELYTDKAGRPRNAITAHLFRKSYGVQRVKSDIGGGSMPLPHLQRLMGHSSIETTRDRYLKFREDDIRDAERRFAP